MATSTWQIVKSACNRSNPSSVRRKSRGFRPVRSIYWEDESQLPPPRQIDIAIVGGGPAGLATAAALLKVDRSLKVEVFERLPYRKSGSSILLNINGQKALEAIDRQLYNNMMAETITLKNTYFYDAHTGKQRSVHEDGSVEMLQKYGKTPRLIGWHEIRETLLEWLPQDVVHFNTQAAYYNTEDDRLVVVFLEDVTPVSCKLLIGADGWFSYTRFQCRHDGPPQFSGSVMWRARVPWRSGLPLDHTRWYVEGDRQKTRFAVVMPTSGGEVVWQACAPVSYLTRVGLEWESQAPRSPSMQGSSAFHQDAKERCLTVFDDFVRDFIDVVDLTDPGVVCEVPLHGRPIDHMTTGYWGRGTITLVGDAAHTAPPNGQGCNLAFEDALVLAHNVQQYGLSEQALRQYETERMARVRDVLLHGSDFSAPEDRERVLYNADFTPLQASAKSIR